MTTSTQINTARELRPTSARAESATRAKFARPGKQGWQPQPCGLSRNELRSIVAEILG
jgi:hypothetical protein